MNTKESIIYNSLDLFSLKGYESVSIRDIAKSVGIKGSSIYNHFSSKQALYNCVINTFSDYVSKSLDKICNFYLNDNVSNFTSKDLNFFIESQSSIFNYLLTDTYSIKLKKILLLEKIQNKKASLLFEKLFITNVLNYSKKIISRLLHNSLKCTDTSLLSFELCSPFFFIFLRSDVVTKEEQLALKKHLTQFSNNYLMGG